MTDGIVLAHIKCSVVQLLLQKSLLSLRAISKFIIILQGLITSGLLVIAFLALLIIVIYLFPNDNMMNATMFRKMFNVHKWI